MHIGKERTRPHDSQLNLQLGNLNIGNPGCLESTAKWPGMKAQWGALS